jgi:hypothetical protein
MATIPDSVGLGAMRIGGGTGCAGGIVTGWLDCCLKRSLALRPGSAFWDFWRRTQLSQLNKPDKMNASTRKEILRSLFIICLLSDSQTAQGKKITSQIADPSLGYSNELGTISVVFTCYIGTYFVQVNIKAYRALSYIITFCRKKWKFCA